MQARQEIKYEHMYRYNMAIEYHELRQRRSSPYTEYLSILRIKAASTYIGGVLIPHVINMVGPLRLGTDTFH
jgi:hypothetical protein